MTTVEMEIIEYLKQNPKAYFARKEISRRARSREACEDRSRRDCHDQTFAMQHRIPLRTRPAVGRAAEMFLVCGVRDAE